MVLPFHFSTDGPSDEKVRKDAEQCFQHPFWTIFTSCFQVFHFSIYFGVAMKPAENIIATPPTRANCTPVQMNSKSFQWEVPCLLRLTTVDYGISQQTPDL
jgi:hypothetical protein